MDHKDWQSLIWPHVAGEEWNMDDLEADMPEFQSHDGVRWIWDNATKSYVQAPGGALPDTDRNHASGGDNDLFDAAQPDGNLFKAKNPELEGYMAHSGAADPVDPSDPAEQGGWSSVDDIMAQLYSEGINVERSWVVERLNEMGYHVTDDNPDQGGQYDEYDPYKYPFSAPNENLGVMPLDWGDKYGPLPGRKVPTGTCPKCGNNEVRPGLLRDQKFVTCDNCGNVGPTGSYQWVMPNGQPPVVPEGTPFKRFQEPLAWKKMPQKQKPKWKFWGAIDGHAEDCGCPECQMQREAEFRNPPPQVHNTGPFPERVMKPNRWKTDNSFPTLTTKTAADWDDWGMEDEGNAAGGAAMPGTTAPTEVGRYVQTPDGKIYPGMGTGPDALHQAIMARNGIDPNTPALMGVVMNDGSSQIVMAPSDFPYNQQALEQQLTQIFSAPIHITYVPQNLAGPVEKTTESFVLKGVVVNLPQGGAADGYAWLKEMGPPDEMLASQVPLIFVAEHAETSDAPIYLYCKGFVTGTGGPLSHAGVVAREKNMACISSVGSDFARIMEGASLSLQPDGTVQVGPPNQQIQQYMQRSPQDWQDSMQNRQNVMQKYPEFVRDWQRGGSYNHHTGSRVTSVDQPFQPAHILEQMQHEAMQPGLDSCPECASPMVDAGNEKVCHSCGSRQPIVQGLLAHQANLLGDAAMGIGLAAPWLLGPEVGAPADAALMGAEGAGAAGAASGAGSLMSRALGMGGASLMGHELAKPVENMVDPMLWGQQNGQQPPMDTSLQGTIAKTAEFGDDSVGNAYRNDGDTANPEHDGEQGFREENNADAPENLGDVNEVGGTKGMHETPDGAIAMFEMVKPLVTHHIENGLDASQNPLIQALDQMLEGHFPGYKGEHQKAANAYQGYPGQNIPPNPMSPGGSANSPGGSCAMCGDPNHTTDQHNGMGNLAGGANGMMPAQQTSPIPQGMQMPPGYSSYEHTAARRPKMCPFHSELVEYSLTLGDASKALTAMAPHQFSNMSCKGGWSGDHKCRFKSDFVNQGYWDAKDAEAEQRREEREQLRAEMEEQQLNAPLDPFEDAITQDIPATDPIRDKSDYDAPFQTSPDEGNRSPSSDGLGSAIGMPMAASWKVVSDDPMAQMHHRHEDRHVEHELSDHDWLDAEGRPLERDKEYVLKSPNYSVPDHVRVDDMTSDKVIVTMHLDNGMDFKKEFTKQAIEEDGSSFVPEGDDPVDNNFHEETDSSPMNEDNAAQEDDLSRGSDHVMANVDPEFNPGAMWLFEGSTVDVDPELMAKLAGKDYSPRQQREFIDERGTARNLEKLDLQNTHYLDDGIDAHLALW